MRIPSHLLWCVPPNAFPFFPPSFSHLQNILKVLLIFQMVVSQNSLTGQIDQREKCEIFYKKEKSKKKNPKTLGITLTPPK